MHTAIGQTNNRNVFVPLYVANFFLALHVFSVAYINSSFLKLFMPETYIGLVFSAGAVLTMLGFAAISPVLRRFGNHRTVSALALVAFFAFVGLISFENAAAIVALYLIYAVLSTLMLFSLDIFIETYSVTEQTTGNVRGVFLTIANTALILSPLIAGFVVGDAEYWRAYLLSAAFLMPFIAIILAKTRNFRDPPYRPFKLLSMFRSLRENRNIMYIFIAQFLMRLFFAWMVIYTPIYLHDHIGFSWSEIGTMLSIILLPYILFELPAGTMADRKYGEKEMLTIGLFITGVATMALSFISLHSFLVWTAVLFITRVGASLIEITTESYFFKHVGGGDADTISCFRILRPLSYIVGPLLATAALLFVDIQHLFLVLGAVVLLGIRYSLALRDTR